MNFVVDVLPSKREQLGAVAHVDGTARVQSVSKDTNAMYWSLINEFNKLTGIPILLNTLFNNNAEPIVDSIEDSILCFLTTGIEYLIIGNYLIEKTNTERSEVLSMRFSLPLTMKLVETRQFMTKDETIESYMIESITDSTVSFPISSKLHRILSNSGDYLSAQEFISGLNSTNSDRLTELTEEIWNLIEKRALSISPR